MSYTCDPTTDRGRVRVLIFDKVPSGTSAVIGTNYFFEDAEIDGALDLNADDLWHCCADLCRSMAAKYADEAINLGLGRGDIKIDKTKKSQFYTNLAQSYMARSGSDVVEYLDSIAYNIDVDGSDNTEYVGDD